MNNQTIVILDFGGQYKELIARRVRECGVYSVILPYDTDVEEVAALKPIGIIFTGGPDGVYAEASPQMLYGHFQARRSGARNMLRYAAYLPPLRRNGCHLPRQRIRYA